MVVNLTIPGGRVVLKLSGYFFSDNQIPIVKEYVEIFKNAKFSPLPIQKTFPKIIGI